MVMIDDALSNIFGTVNPSKEKQTRAFRCGKAKRKKQQSKWHKRIEAMSWLFQRFQVAVFTKYIQYIFMIIVKYNNNLFEYLCNQIRMFNCSCNPQSRSLSR